MKRLFFLVGLFFWVPPVQAQWGNSLPKCNSEKEYSTKDLTARSKFGVVMITTDDARGSGFVVRQINNQTLILTNSHVIKGSRQIIVEWSDGNKDSAVVVLDGGATTNLTDLALLKVEGKEGRVLPLKQGQAIVGADVVAIGFPKGLSFTISKGVVSGLRDQGGLVQTDTAINQGSSGGPLINSSGCVVGVNTLAGKPEAGAVNINFAISSQVAQRFVDKYDPDNPQTIYRQNQSISVNSQNQEKDVECYTYDGFTTCNNIKYDGLFTSFYLPYVLNISAKQLPLPNKKCDSGYKKIKLIVETSIPGEDYKYHKTNECINTKEFQAISLNDPREFRPFAEGKHTFVGTYKFFRDAMNDRYKYNYDDDTQLNYSVRGLE